MKRLVAVLLAAFLITACGGGDKEEGEPTTTESATTAEPTTTAKPFDGEAYADEIEKAFTGSAAVDEIGDMCQRTSPEFTWHCYYDGIEATSPSQVRLLLLTPGGLSDDELAEVADQAALHFFNFVGKDFSELDTIVGRVNGIDLGHLFRRDVPLLNRD